MLNYKKLQNINLQILKIYITVLLNLIKSVIQLLLVFDNIC